MDSRKEYRVYHYCFAKMLGTPGSMKTSLDIQLYTDKVDKSYIDKYYHCVHEDSIDPEEGPIETLRKIYALFNGKDNPLQTEEKQAELIKLDSHTSTSTGDIVYYQGDYYIVGPAWFRKLE